MVDVNPGDGNCADAAGMCGLRTAVAEANALGGTHTINLPIGNYLLTGTAYEDLAVSGDLDITCALSIIGTDTRNTFIDPAGNDRAFQIFAGASLLIEQLSIVNGAIAEEHGGAIYNNGSLQLEQVAISSCTSTGSTGVPVFASGGGFGGAIYNDGDLTLSKSLINNCIAQGGDGQNGVFPGGGGGGGGSAGMGGAIFNASGATAGLINSTLSGNAAIGGKGGNGTHHDGTGTIESDGGNGGGEGATGGVSPDGSATGTAGFGGGGGGGASIGGTGSNGGIGGGAGSGGSNSFGGPAGASGTAGMFGGAAGTGCCSEAGGAGGGAGLGGGIFNNGATLTLNSCTVAFNSTTGGLAGNGYFGVNGAPGEGVGGGILNWNVGAITLENSLIAENMGPNVAPDLYGVIASAGYNLVLDPADFLFLPSSPNDILGQDPLINPLANLGGPTDVHAPVCGSVLINAGDSDQALDQSCGARPVGSADDIGAYESPIGAPAFIKN